MLVYQPCGCRDDAGDPICNEDLLFEIGVRGFDEGESGDTYGINVVPGTTSSFISLDEDVICTMADRLRVA
jgi:hypothetical protein